MLAILIFRSVPGTLKGIRGQRWIWHNPRLWRIYNLKRHTWVMTNCAWANGRWQKTEWARYQAISWRENRTHNFIEVWNTPQGFGLTRAWTSWEWVNWCQETDMKLDQHSKGSICSPNVVRLCFDCMRLGCF
jgi:hypothetical protein